MERIESARLVFALDVLYHSAKFLEGTLILGASLAPAIAEMEPVLCFYRRC